MLRPGRDQVQEVKILNRIISWDRRRGLIYEVDPRHVEIIIEQFRLEDAKTVATPGAREEGRTHEDDHEVLSDEYTTKYRAFVARCNHIAPDRPDIAVAVKELARSMATPTKGDWQRLKRLGRYLKGVHTC